MSGYIGDAGEFFVASELSRRGWKCSVVKGNVPSADLMVAHPETKESKVIEVKSFGGKGSSVSWTIKTIPDVANLIYVLVDFRKSFSEHWPTTKNDTKRPHIYVLTIEEMKKIWNDKHGIHGNGGVRKSSFDPIRDYQEKWGKIFDEDSDLSDGYQNFTMKQLDDFKANKIASRRFANKGKRKDGTWRKGWSQSTWRKKVNDEKAKIKRDWKKKRKKLENESS